MNLIVEQFSPDSLDAKTAEAWERFVSMNPASGFMQRLNWARFKSKMGQIARIILVRADHEIIAGTLVYAGHDAKKPSIMVAPYGPVLPWNDDQLARQSLRLILQSAEQISRELNIVSFRVEPRIEHPVPNLLREFGAGPCNLVPAETLLLDLRASENEILAQMKAKCRYNISLSQRRGVQVRELALEQKSSLELLYSMLEEASDRDDFYLEPRSFFETLLSEFSGAGDKMLRLYIAEHESDLLGALLLVVEGKRATYLYGGISNKKRSLMPGYALQWKAITDGKLAGCESYDFYGFDQFAVPHHAYARFSRFKRGFGGRAVRFIGAQDYVFMDRLVDNVVMFFQDLPETSCLKNSDDKPTE